MTKSFDVFLSYNSKSEPAVRELAEALRARGLKVWLDEWELVPGRPWQEALQEIIETTGSAAVLVGKDGLGPWHTAEMQACLSEFVDRGLPVIPVLLPGAPKMPKLPLFLKAFTGVDLRSGLSEEGLDRVQWGVTGTKPDRLRLPANERPGQKPRPASHLAAWIVLIALLAITFLAFYHYLSMSAGSRTRRTREPVPAPRGAPVRSPSRLPNPPAQPRDAPGSAPQAAQAAGQPSPRTRFDPVGQWLMTPAGNEPPWLLTLRRDRGLEMKRGLEKGTGKWTFDRAHHLLSFSIDMGAGDALESAPPRMRLRISRLEERSFGGTDDVTGKVYSFARL